MTGARRGFQLAEPYDKVTCNSDVSSTTRERLAEADTSPSGVADQPPLVAGKFLRERIHNQLRRRQISLVRMFSDVELGDVEHLSRARPRRQTIESGWNQRLCNPIDVPETRSPLVGTVAGARVISLAAVREQLAPVYDLRQRISRSKTQLWIPLEADVENQSSAMQRTRLS